MRSIYKILSVAAMVAALGACKENGFEIVNTPAVNVTTEKLSPNTDESGTVRAYAGTEVTAKGLNLDKVGAVRLGGLDAEIVSQDMKTLVFKVPVLDKPQQDDPYMVLLEVMDSDRATVVFKYDYFVTVPVTDALVSGFSPAEGTVGEVVAIAGRNLGQVTSVTFGDVSVKAADFTSAADAEIKFAVPAVTVKAANTPVDIKAIWSGGTIDVTSAGKFTFKVPYFASYTQGDAAKLGDEITLSGENLDLVSGFKWGDTEILISEQTATSIVVKIPSGIEQANPAVVSADLKAFFGTPEQPVVVRQGFKVDTTPIGPAAPVFTSIAPADAAYSSIFLAKEVVVKGQNMASVEKFEIDGVEAALKGEATDIEARFVVPSTISGTAAKDVTLVAIWNGGNRADFGTVKVYPFYHTKGLRLRIGSNSKSTYPAENREEAFLLLNEGRVISVQEWNDMPLDPFAKSGTNTVTTSANKVTGSESDYYSVQPYVFAITNSSNKLSFVDPANTANQLKCHFLGGTTALPTTFGTPVIFWTIVTNEVKDKVVAGTLDDIVTGAPKASAGAPALGASETSSTWTKGSVLTMQYMGYSYASQAQKPDENLGGVRQNGYLYIKDITCGNLTTGQTVADRSGYIDVELWWSNVL